MSLLDKYCPQVDFSNYEDFKKNFRINTPDNFNFAYDVVDYYADHEPNRMALVWCDDKGQERTMTFAELRKESNQTANVFLAHGVKKGDAVMLCLKGRWHFWTCLIALHKIGAIAVPATHMMQVGNIVYRLQKLNFTMILAAKEATLMANIKEAVKLEGKDIVCASVDGEVSGWKDFNALVQQASSVLDAKNTTCNSDTMLLYFTSGTTGFPKMIELDYSYPLAHIITAKFWQNNRDHGLHYTVADTGWAKCAWGKIYGQWLCGTAVFAYDYEQFNAFALLKKICDYKVTSFCAPPTVYRMLIKEDLTSFDFSNLEYCVVAGEPLNPEVYNRWLEKTGLKLYEGYGQTESVVQVATTHWQEPKPGSMGLPLPIYDIRLINAQGIICKPGETGEIAIKANINNPPVGLFHGYRDDQELTESVWYDGWYHTGDLATQDDDGFLWFVGRADDLIKTSGYRVGPFEVESALMQHQAVLECAITGIPDPLRGQVIKATIVLTKEYRENNSADDFNTGPYYQNLKEELQAHVKKVTEPYKYPRIIEFVEELPKTISGKIRRVQIREADENILQE